MLFIFISASMTFTLFAAPRWDDVVEDIATASTRSAQSPRLTARRVQANAYVLSLAGADDCWARLSCSLEMAWMWWRHVGDFVRVGARAQLRAAARLGAARGEI